MSRALSISLQNRRSEVGRLVDLLESFGAEAGLPMDVTYRVTLALDEVVSNVIRHGYADSGDHRIDVTVKVNAHTVTASVADDGRPYDPRESPAPDLESPIEARRIGGLGMHLVRAMMDTIAYQRADGRNVLTLTTSLTPRQTD